jgi:hypothetical protein
MTVMKASPEGGIAVSPVVQRATVPVAAATVETVE